MSINNEANALSKNSNKKVKFTDTYLKSLKPKNKPYLRLDSDWLYICVLPSGLKCWHFKYRQTVIQADGTKKQKDIPPILLGHYPDLSLQKARIERDKAKASFKNGIDYRQVLAAQKDKQQTDNSLKKWAIEWLKTKTDVTENSMQRFTGHLNNHIYPVFAKRDVNSINSDEILDFINKIKDKGQHETAKNCKAFLSQIFRFAILKKACSADPIYATKGLIKNAKHKPMPAITDPRELGQLLRAIDAYQGSAIVVLALKLTPYLLLRPIEVRCSILIL